MMNKCYSIGDLMSMYYEREFAAVEQMPIPKLSSKHNRKMKKAFRIFAENRISMLADITSALAEMRVSILQINTQTKSDGQCIISIGVACKNLDHYLSIVSRIKNINGVYSIERGYTS